MTRPLLWETSLSEGTIVCSNRETETLLCSPLTVSKACPVTKRDKKVQGLPERATKKNRADGQKFPNKSPSHKCAETPERVFLFFRPILGGLFKLGPCLTGLGLPSFPLSLLVPFVQCTSQRLFHIESISVPSSMFHVGFRDPTSRGL